MSSRTIRGLFLLALVPLSIASCSDRAPLAPTDQAGAARQPGSLQSNQHGRPIKGQCTTTITFLEPGAEGQCAAFLPVLASAFIRIDGACTVSHLGRTNVTAIQQLLFELDQNGVPVVTALRNCSTLTAANGDALTHTTTGVVAPAGPADVSFTGPLTFTGGTGRFAGASGSATFNGTASLATNTGAFSFEGTVAY
jgi:hypothetical protein